MVAYTKSRLALCLATLLAAAFLSLPAIAWGGELESQAEPSGAVAVVPADDDGGAVVEAGGTGGEVAETQPVDVPVDAAAGGAAGQEAGVGKTLEPLADEDALLTAAPAPPSAPQAAAGGSPGDADADEEAPKARSLGAQAEPEPEAPSVRARTLDDGIYYLESGLNLSNVLNIAKSSKSNGGNAFSDAYSGSASQRWRITYNPLTGAYSIVNVNSGLALDVAGARAAGGTNVQQYRANGTLAQQWFFETSGSGYRIISALGAFALDIAGANKNAGANVQIWGSNGTAAQLWQCLSTAGHAAEAAVVEEGVYLVSPKAAPGMRLDVQDVSVNDGANVHIWSNSDAQNQRWYISRDASNYYTIVSLGSGKALDVASARMVAGANVQQYAQNGSNAQKWALRDNGDGSYTFISKLNGMALDLVSGKTSNGTNAQMYLDNGTAAQRFVLAAASMVADGVYSIAPGYARSKTLDVPAAGTGAGLQLQIWDYDSVTQQKFQVTNLGDDVYTIMAGISGKYLAQSGSKAVQSWADTSSPSQRWKATWAGDGVTLTNQSSGQVLDISGASTANGAKAQLWASNGTKAQRFGFVRRNVIDDGYYFIQSLTGSRVLDVAELSSSNGANAQIWSKSGGFNQRFQITYVSDGCYKIVNLLSGKALDVAGGRNANGANVQQWAYNGSGAQLWRAEFSPNGGIVFVNKGTGKVLDVAGGRNANGANVDIWTANGTNAQRWNVTATTALTDLQMKAYHKAVAHGSSTNWYISVDLSNHRVYIFHRANKSAGWELQKDWIMTCGHPTTPTPTGEYTVKRKFYSYSDYYAGYTAYYYTSIGNTGKYFHSPLYGPGKGPGTKTYGGWGKNLSLGCVRLYLENAIWMQKNVDKGTHISIYY